MIEPEQPEVASMEEMSQIFVNPHELLDVDPIPMPQDIDEQAFPLLEEQPHEQDINDSIAYTASMQLENNPLDDSAFLTAPAQLDPIDESILEVEAAENTILRQKLESNTETKFSSLKAVSKSQAARYFFDALLLKTNDLIKVKQEYPYGEIIIQAKVAVTNSGRTVCNLTLTDECHDNLMSLIQIN